MPENWVLNASPVILLAKVGHLHLFTALADQIVIPQAVAREIEAGPFNDPGKRALVDLASLIVETEVPPPELLAWDIGHGETAVLTHALANPGWVAVLDDAAARRCAAAFSVPVKGTLSVVILAKKLGHIESAASVIRLLLNQGFYIDGKLIRDVLKATVAEDWS